MKFLKGFLVFLLGFMFITFMNLFLILHSSSKIMSEDNISNIIKNIDVTELVETAKIEEAFEGSNLSKETVKNIINNEELKEVVGGYISDIIKSVVVDGVIPDVDEKKLHESLKKSLDIVIAESKKDPSFNLTEKEINDLYKEIDKVVPEIVSNLEENKEEINKVIAENVSEDSEYKGIAFILKVLRIAFNTRFIFLVIAIVCLGFIVLIRFENMRFMKTIAILLFIFAAETLIFGTLVNAVYDIVAADATAKNILSVPVKLLANINIKTGVISIIMGVALLVGRTLRLNQKEIDA